MWNIFKKDKEFIIRYRYVSLNLDTIIFAQSRQKAIEKFIRQKVYSNIISVTENMI